LTGKTVDVPDELWEEFRIEVRKRFGRTQGNMPKAFQEALKLWMDNPKKKEVEKVG